MARWTSRALALALVLLAPLPALGATVTVFAAASLSEALSDVAAAYQRQTGSAPALSFAASSVLARQIEASSGADVFVAADTEWMDYLAQRGLIQPATRRNLLGNRLVLIAPADTKVTLAIAPRFALARALGGGRLALADPDSVPAGKYARAALSALGVWDSVAAHVASAENVRAALAYVARGEAPFGVVYRTDALGEKRVRIVGTFPEGSHDPIVYPAALTREAGPEAAQFLRFLSGVEARTIFRKHGFIVLKTP